ncbi:MAG: hypothetical protein LBT22_00030 [Peptococcaceae bacterium]|jgi:hypothetical protein|nr:hypothetical protein [Peptococcaceae bacterium]
MRKRWAWLFVGAFLLVMGGSMLKLLLWRPDPLNLVTKGLEHLNAAASFRYTMIQHQNVAGNDRLLTQIQGEKDGENVRITGTLIGSEIEMIKINGVLYHKDPFSQRWLQFNETIPMQEVFLAELNPLASLQFKELGEVELQGQERVNGEKAYVCALKPSVQNQIMEEFWTDFAYTLYLKKSGGSLLKAVITAKSKATSEPMSMTLEFADMGKRIQIQAPVVEES